MTTDAAATPHDTFFRRKGKSYVPTVSTRGPWDPDSLNGRVIAGLLMYELERLHLDPAFQVARLTVDMFRVARMRPVSVVTKVVRDGNRIRVADASLQLEDGTEIARASIVMLRRTAAPEENVWAPPSWDVPHPDALPQPPQPKFSPVIWETRPITGQIALPRSGPPVQNRAWTRDVIDFVDGERPSPLVRAALASDLANPYANSGDTGLNYVNSDVSLYLHRDPTGDWIGVEAAAHHASAGIAIGECVLYDLDGAFGRSTVCSVANQRRHDALP